MAVLKRADILKGVNKIEKVTIKALDGELFLRALSSAEIDEITDIEAKGFGEYETNNKTLSHRGKVKNEESNSKAKINVSKVNKKSNEAVYTMIHKSLSNKEYKNDPFTYDDITKLSKDAINELKDKIREISGWTTTDEDVENFLED